jgi:hypothetical protein
MQTTAVQHWAAGMLVAAAAALSVAALPVAAETTRPTSQPMEPREAFADDALPPPAGTETAAPAPEGPPTAPAAEKPPAPVKPQAPRAKGKPVYASDFEAKPGAEWSHNKTSTTPAGARTFLGQFGNDTVSLTLLDLPRHAYLRVSFDLFVLLTWDGSGSRGSDDIWQLDVAGGPVLLTTTFTNNDVLKEDTGIRQAYPGEYPSCEWRGQTGAAEKCTLGYTYTFLKEGGGLQKVDSVYKLSFAFPHTAREVTLNFSARNLTPLRVNDESWGLDNVKVEAFAGPPAGKVGRKALAQLWEALDDADPVAAERAVCRLLECGRTAAAFLREKLKKQHPDPEPIRKLIAQLDADSFRDREAATRELVKKGLAAKPLLTEALAAAGSEETRARLQEIIQKVQGPGLPASLRTARALRVLRILQPDPSTRPAGAAGEPGGVLRSDLGRRAVGELPAAEDFLR